MNGGAGASTGDDFFEQLEMMKVPKVCKRCTKAFTDFENMGAWRCRYHPCDLNAAWRGEHYDRNHYDCCGLQDDNPSEAQTFEQRRPFGCTVADHTAKPGGAGYSEHDNVEIPLQYVGLFRLFAESSTVDLDRGVVVVRRYNRQVAEERQQFGQVIHGVNKAASLPL